MTQDKIIEVEIRDSIACRIEIVQYTLSVYEGEGNEIVQKYLTDNSIKYSKKQFAGAKTYYEYIADFLSWAQVEELKRISENKSIGVEGKLLSTFHELTTDEIDTLYKKILDSSKLEASMIARAMGKEIGEIVKVGFNPNKMARGTWDAYPPFSNTVGHKINIPEDKQDTMPKDRTLVVQYSFS